MAGRKLLTYMPVALVYRRGGWSRGKVYISAANESVPQRNYSVTPSVVNSFYLFN